MQNQQIKNGLTITSKIAKQYILQTMASMKMEVFCALYTLFINYCNKYKPVFRAINAEVLPDKLLLFGIYAWYSLVLVI
jgi:hypothetical protein